MDNPNLDVRAKGLAILARAVTIRTNIKRQLALVTALEGQAELMRKGIDPDTIESFQIIPQNGKVHTRIWLKGAAKSDSRLLLNFDIRTAAVKDTEND